MWPPLDYYAYACLFDFIMTGVFTFYVISKKPELKLARLFCIFSSGVAVWCLFYFISLKVSERVVSEFFLRTCMVPVAFLPSSFFHFVTELIQRKVSPWVHRLNYMLSGVTVLTIYTNLFAISGAPQHLVFPYWPEPGPIFPLHVLHFVGVVFIAHMFLLKAIRESSGLRRSQIQMVFWGMLIAFVSGISNYLTWYRTPIPPVLMPLVSMLVFAMGYAIVRHQLLDIQVVVKRTVVFAGLVVSVVAVVSLMAFLSQDVLVRYVAIPRWLSNVFAAAIIAALYGRLRDWLTNATERYLFQKKYDYKELLKKFTDEVMAMVNLKELLQMTVKTLSETVKLDGCSLLLLNKDTRKYELVASLGTNGHQVVLEESEPFTTFLRETHEPIGTDGALAKVHFPSSVTERMRQLHARLCLPLNVHEDLIGVLCLGKKKSDEEFTKDDFDILMPLSRTLGIAISNAQLFDELAKTQAEAAQKEKLAVIGTLSAGINHEICNPLGIVKAQCEAFLLDQQDGILVGRTAEELLERTSSIMNIALKQIDRATAITQKLSNFAKPIKEATAQPVSVAQEVEEVLLLVGHDLKLEKIEIKKELQQDLPQIIADRRQLQEVLFNLVRNAGQAITPPGMITIRARLHEGNVRVEIEDTGSGIAPDKLGKIYDPFFTTKEPGKGTGLGLFIVRQIVERNKGRISVESMVGKGTTFFLDFPAAKVTAAAVAH